MIVIAEGADGSYQVIGEASSKDEAREMIANYVKIGPQYDLLAPERFVIHSRGIDGFFTKVEVL